MVCTRSHVTVTHDGERGRLGHYTPDYQIQITRVRPWHVSADEYIIYVCVLRTRSTMRTSTS